MSIIPQRSQPHTVNVAFATETGHGGRPPCPRARAHRPLAWKHGSTRDRLLAGRMAPLCGRDAGARMVREPRRDPTKVGCDPRRGAASVTRDECQRVGLWRGSRRRSRRGLPRSSALRVAFGSHPNGRSPIACRPPRDRRCGRFPGGCSASLDTVPDWWPCRGARTLLPPDGDSLTLLHGKVAELYRKAFSRRRFSQKQAGISPQSPLCFTDTICT